jgi:hypothetical protein
MNKEANSKSKRPVARPEAANKRKKINEDEVSNGMYSNIYSLLYVKEK